MSTYSLEELLQDFEQHHQVKLPENSTADAADVKAAAAENTQEPVFIVLDDDPTGTQSVANLPVLTRWEREDLEWAFEQSAPAIYVMTNSRSLSASDAEQINRDVAEAALAVAKDKDLRVSFVSRSDSTLRGHFPLEPDTLAQCVEKHDGRVDGVIVVPAFGDAGRITIGGVHYAGNATDGFIPVAESEFAQDATFGYSHSDLAEWIEEKTAGDTSAEQVIRIPLDLLRGDVAAVAAELAKAKNRHPIIVDIVTEEDLRQLALAVIEAESAGMQFIYRVGPPFMRARIGQNVPTPLDQHAVAQARTTEPDTKGGLIVVGSHVPTTTRQLNALLEKDSAEVIELDVRTVLSDEREYYLERKAQEVIGKLQESNVILHTSRELVKGEDAEESLAIAREVSGALIAVVNKTAHTVKPKFVIAKGGITSSDVASRGLEMTRATVIGPMQPGIISLWQLGDGPAAGVPYIVFAGNVGNDQSLADVAETLSNA
jgi:uncharacterized protein YgbK (DUF1537 family)